MKTFPSQKNIGFTLLETLIAIAILTVAVAAAFGVAQKALMSSAFSKNQTSAFFLATEGLELVRNVRDDIGFYNTDPANLSTDPITQIDWLKHFKTVCNSSALDGTCGFDVNPVADLTTTEPNGGTNGTPLKLCTATTGCPLSVVNSGGEIYYSSSLASPITIFSRKITMTEKCYSNWAGTNAVNCNTNPDGKKEVTVTSTVYWLGESFSISEVLTNWR